MKRFLSLILSFYWVFPIISTQEPAISTLFVHGLGSNATQALFYAENHMATCSNVHCSINRPTNWYILKNPVYSFDFPHVHNKPHKQYVSLAQDIEIASLKEACAAVPGPKILMGVSMGASTILNYTSLYYTPDIKALIAETPFDEVESILKSILGFTYEGLKNLAHSWIYPLYNPNGIKPLFAIQKLPKELPILLVHASTDELIPLQCSRHLYYHLRQNGHRHVYLLELSAGKHANYIFAKDAQKYQETVHAFYKKYNLPHDETLARQGEKYLADAHPW